MKLQEQLSRMKSMMDLQEQYYNPGLGMTPQASRDMGERFHNKKPVSADDAVDIVSAILDGIPGIGNLASLVTDIGHTISYLYRMVFATEESVKIEYAVLAATTFMTAFIPFGGVNTVNIIIRQGIKPLLRMTPEQITKWAIRKRIINPMILLQKGRFKYCLLLLLVRILKDETSEMLSKAISNITKLQEIISKYKFPDFFVNGLDDLKKLLIEINKEELIRIASEILKKSQDLKDFEFTPTIPY